MAVYHDNGNNKEEGIEAVIGKTKGKKTQPKDVGKKEMDIQIGRTASWHDIFKTSSLTELKHKEERERMSVRRELGVRS